MGLTVYGCGASGGGTSATTTTTIASATGLYLHLEGATTAVTSLEVDTQTQLFTTYRDASGTTDPTLSTTAWFCDTTIGTIPATGNWAGRFKGMYLGTGEITAVTSRGLVTQEVTVVDTSTVYTAPTTFTLLPYNFNALWAEYHDGGSGEAWLNSHLVNPDTYFTDMAEPFMSWFYWRVHTHTEGSMKWYLGGWDEYQQVPVVEDGEIVYAAYGADSFSNRLVTIEGEEYYDDIYVGLKVTYGSGSNDYVIAEYGHILCKKSIYENSAVANYNQGEGGSHGTGLSVSAGEIIGLWGNTKAEFDPVTYERNSYGGDFVISDPQANHRDLAKNHTNYNNVNPMLFYAGSNLAAVQLTRASLEALMAQSKKAPFVQPQGIGEIGEINHANEVWGYWYNKVQVDNGLQGSYFNMATVAFIHEDQTNSETFTMPSDDGDGYTPTGMYCEDAADPGETDASNYVWDVQVFQSDEGEIFGSYCYTSFVSLVSGDSSGGIIHIVAPGSSSGSGFNITTPLQERWAKFEVVSTSASDWRDDVLKIKYFSSLSEASSGSLSGSIYEDDDYYEFRKSLYGLY